MEIIGLDIGYGYTKGIIEGKAVMFPSVVARGRLPKFRTGLASSNSRIVLQNGQGGTHFVGDMALSQSLSGGKDTTSHIRTDTDEFYLLFQAAMSSLVSDGEILLVTGLPVNHFGADAQKVKRIFEAQHSINRIGAENKQFEVRWCIVTVQGFGILCSYILNERGKIIKDMSQVDVAVVDFGRYNTNFAYFHNFEYIAPLSYSLDKGMAIVHESLRQDIMDKYNLDFSLYEVDHALVNGKVVVAGKEKDITRLARPHLEELAETVQAQAASLWGNARKVHTVLISGGGCTSVGKLFARNYNNAAILGGMMDNAIGNYRYGLLKSR